MPVTKGGAASGMENWFVSQDPANQAFLDSYKATIESCVAQVDAELAAAAQ